MAQNGQGILKDFGRGLVMGATAPIKAVGFASKKLGIKPSQILKGVGAIAPFVPIAGSNFAGRFLSKGGELLGKVGRGKKKKKRGRKSQMGMGQTGGQDASQGQIVGGLVSGNPALPNGSSSAYGYVRF